MRLCAVVFVALFSACDSPGETDDRPCRLAERAICEHFDGCGQNTGSVSNCVRSLAESNDGQGMFCADEDARWDRCPPALETYECHPNALEAYQLCFDLAEQP